MNNITKNKRLGALDIFIIIVFLVCAISVGLRSFAVNNSEVRNDVPLEDYILSFKISNIKDSSAKNYLEKGSKFYLNDSDAYLGTVSTSPTINDAVRYYEMLDGSIVAAKNNATGDLYRVDVESSMTVQGVTSADGKFLLGGNQYIAMNKEIEVYSKYLSVKITVTGISKAQ